MEELIDFQEELNNPGYVFPMIGVRTFVDHFLPPLKDGVDVKNIKSMLKKRGYVDSADRWKSLWVVSGRSRRKKYDTFAPLFDIFQKVTSVASATASYLDQILEMVAIPEHHKNRRRNVSSQNACFILNDRPNIGTGSAINSWANIALTAGFRKNDSGESCRKNARRIISNIQLAMVRDPSRRFCFGITIENTSLRLWFCSRASPVVSKSFDFSNDLDLLIHVFLSLAFASKEELGWDPTFRPFERQDGRLVYHIDIGEETYETDSVLSKNSANQLVGHATRVWIVHRLGSDVQYVLKDAWTEDDQKPEHLVHEMLLHDVEDKFGAEVRQKVASHLLTPIAHCLVCVNGEEDHTTNVMMRGYMPSFKEQYRINVENLGNHDDDNASPTEIGVEGLGRGDLKDPLSWYNPLRRILRRKHYRVVFKEIAKPLSTVRKLPDVFTVLSDSAKVLKWIHGAGWVHRDLSVGNLYLYGEHGLIGDLEYAKLKNTDVEHELLIGTPDFIAVEAADRAYGLLPRVDRVALDAELTAMEEGRWEDVALLRNSRRPPPFSHNDLHDLESLWWIAIWELFYHDEGLKSDAEHPYDKERDEQRKLAAAELFPRSSETDDRRCFLQSGAYYCSSLAWMPDRLHNVKAALNALRKTFFDNYSKFEAGFPDIRTDVFYGTHDKAQLVFERCKEYASDRRLVRCRKDGSCRPLFGLEKGPQALRIDNPRWRIDHERLKNSTRAPEVAKCSPRGKRKRDDDDGVLSMPPKRIAR
ncbi:hypothetical protein ACEPAG_9450 [Sanghuangporus baumii]